jgi:HEAT repeat protein
MGRIAAGFALLIIGVLSGWLIGRETGENSQVSAIRNDLNEMKQLVALSQLQNKSASDRIMATYEFKKLDSASDEILDALIYTFQNDDNPNVKNAAAEALFKFGNRDKVRKAFIHGLTTQSDPLLQINLIEMLVGLNEKRALPKLQQMMEQENQMKVVKQKAAEGIGRLL